eukprot:768455-Hanusia_phi.AAC.7
MLVDDLFLPFPYHYNSTVSAVSHGEDEETESECAQGETALVGICGAQVGREEGWGREEGSGRRGVGKCDEESETFNTRRRSSSVLVMASGP